MIAPVIHVYMEFVLMNLTDLLVYVLVDMKERHALLVSTLPYVTADQERNLCLNNYNTRSGYSVNQLCFPTRSTSELVRFAHSLSKKQFKSLTNFLHRDNMIISMLDYDFNSLLC